MGIDRETRIALAEEGIADNAARAKKLVEQINNNFGIKLPANVELFINHQLDCVVYDALGVGDVE